MAAPGRFDGLFKSQCLYLLHSDTVRLRNLLIALAPLTVDFTHDGDYIGRRITHYQTDIAISLLADNALLLRLLQRYCEGVRE